MEPPPNGYARMADMVGQYPETAIFSRFARLNAKNLLYMQAELVQMEYELDTVAFEDSQGDDPNRRSFQAYVYNMKKARGPDSLQWRMVLEIRQRLKEYNETLLQHVKLYKLNAPSVHDLKMVRNWIEMPEGGNHFLRAREAKVFNSPDLVSLHIKAKDPFTRWMCKKATPCFHRILGRFFKNTIGGDEESGLVHYNDATLLGIARILSILVSALLPSVSVVVLYFVDRLIDRLAVIMGFSVTFSVSLALFTSARRVDIFAASAAFASVQVIFVGSTTPASI
ncbi:hypothetical protein MMC14_010541 [Varicellaria rhodocarpa]|nr:hypothetical protein [Varicellaria rhodocarpa]